MVVNIEIEEFCRNRDILAPEEKEAFRIVFRKLKERELFCGKYDAANGNSVFMQGIATVMEDVAYYAGDDEFWKVFAKNAIISDCKWLEKELYRVVVCGEVNAERFKEFCEGNNIPIEKEKKTAKEVYIFRVRVKLAGDLRMMKDYVEEDNITPIDEGDTSFD